MIQSMEEIVNAEIDQCRQQNPEITENGLYVGHLNNFPTYLPNTKYRSPPQEVREGRVSHEKFKRDVQTAIRESFWSLDPEAIKDKKEAFLAYVNFLSHLGMAEGTAELHRRFIYPVYIKLREMDYTHSGLCS